MADLTMNRQGMIEWAQRHADGPVVASPDPKASLSSKLIRFRWNDAPTIAVGADADGKTRINAVLDALASVLTPQGPTAPTVQLLVGTDGTSIDEHLDAIGTLVSEVSGGPQVKVWTIAPGSEPIAFEAKRARFNSGSPAKWAGMLMTAAAMPVDGMAAAIAAALSDRPAFALYPKLSSLTSPRPWQMRLDGLEIGRTGTVGTIVQLASKDLSKQTEPRLSWLKVVGPNPVTFGPGQVTDVVALVDRLIAAWSDSAAPGAVLAHGQAEHALEAHILSGRTTLDSSGGRLTRWNPGEPGDGCLDVHRRPAMRRAGRTAS